jgi:hypothetical protein
MATQRDTNSRCTASKLGAWTVVLCIVAMCQSLSGVGQAHEPCPHHLLGRIQPQGGWHPDGGGLLHWWNPNCFPRCGGPDSYCRKPPPRVCWPPYPPYYILVAPPVAGSSCRGCP